MIENHCHESKYRFNEANRNIKDERSSSEPLKIMLKSTSQQNNKTNHTLARSWTDKSFYQDTLDCYLFNKCSQLSRSECFLDLIDSSKNQENYKNNVSSIDSLSSTFSLMSSYLCNKKYTKSNRNLPKYRNDTPHSSSEESIDSTNNNQQEENENINEKNLPNLFFEDGLKLNESDLNDKDLNNIKKEEAETFIQDFEDETQDKLINSEDDLPKPLINDNKPDENTINESNISDSSFLSTTLNESNGESSPSSQSSFNSPPNVPYLLKKSTKPELEIQPSRGSFRISKRTSSPNIDAKFFGNDDDFFTRAFMPKKSCLKKLLPDFGEETESSVNATSSPLGSPRSTNSSLHWSSTTEGTNSSQNQSISLNTSKKRVSFADVCGKELYSVRTMQEPSNCPPKLTSKIVQYFLNREFSSSQTDVYNQITSSFQMQQNNFMNNCLQQRDPFFNTKRNYEYGISAQNYTNDVNQLKGSIAVYSLNFAQPAGDYFRFRKRIEERCVSLENVLLNGFQINGTIKVKNICFEKNVFLRCSFNKWKTYEDYPAIYVPCDYYSSSSVLSSSPTSSSLSAAFYDTNHSTYQPQQHKEYDTFRFEFTLPKEAKPEIVDKLSIQKSRSYTSNITASIEFCICYQSGAGDSYKEYWDSNNDSNYEILQYLIDLERLKPLNKQQSITSNRFSDKNKKNYFKYESNYSSSSSSCSNLTAGSMLDHEIYY